VAEGTISHPRCRGMVPGDEEGGVVYYSVGTDRALVNVCAVRVVNAGCRSVVFSFASGPLVIVA